MASLLDRWRKPAPALDRRRSLKGVPVRHKSVSVETETTPDAGMVLLNRITRGKGWWSRFAPPVIEQRLELDELGAFVFGLIDGRRDVARIIEEFAARYRVNRREAELSTAAFLRKLAQKRLISIVIN